MPRPDAMTDPSSSFDPDAAAAAGTGIYGLSSTPEEARVHLLPVPFDATASYRKGAAQGPAAIEVASRQVDLFDPVTGRPYEAGIWMAPDDGRVRAWNDEAATADVARVNAIGDELNAWVRDAAEEALIARKLFGVVGGEHSVPFGSIEAHAARFPGMGVLHIDAHADLREAYGGCTWSHASILHNVVTRIDSIASVLQVGVRDLCGAEEAAIRATPKVTTLFDHEWAAARFAGHRLHSIVRASLRALPHNVYVTFDIDGLDPSLCPNTGTPVPGGLTWQEVMLWLGELVATGRRIVGFDVVEVAPGSDRPPGEGLDEIIGARLLYRLIGFALGG